METMIEPRQPRRLEKKTNMLGAGEGLALLALRAEMGD